MERLQRPKGVKQPVCKLSERQYDLNVTKSHICPNLTILAWKPQLSSFASFVNCRCSTISETQVEIGGAFKTSI